MSFASPSWKPLSRTTSPGIVVSSEGVAVPLSSVYGSIEPGQAELKELEARGVDDHDVLRLAAVVLGLVVRVVVDPDPTGVRLEHVRHDRLERGDAEAELAGHAERARERGRVRERPDRAIRSTSTSKVPRIPVSFAPGLLPAVPPKMVASLTSIPIVSTSLPSLNFMLASPIVGLSRLIGPRATGAVAAAACCEVESTVNEPAPRRARCTLWPRRGDTTSRRTSWSSRGSRRRTRR